MGLGSRFLLMGVLLAGTASPAAANCPCPKSKMVELYGTVSMFPPAEPGPRRRPARPDTSLPAALGPTVPVTVLPSMVEVGHAAFAAEEAMRDAVEIPVTVKCRLGIDDQTSDAFLDDFVGTVASSGCQSFYVHARIALLNGLSPAQNRSIPPLRHDRVITLKRRFQYLQIHLNGGLQTTEDVCLALQKCDGAMIGRAAYHDPLLLARIHRVTHKSGPEVSALDLLDNYRNYLGAQLDNGVSLKSMTRHLLGLFSGVPGARNYRRVLSDTKRLARNDLSILDEALRSMSPQSGAA